MTVIVTCGMGLGFVVKQEILEKVPRPWAFLPLDQIRDTSKQAYPRARYRTDVHRRLAGGRARLSAEYSARAGPAGHP